MRRALTGFVFASVAALSGCSEGILDPKGPIGAAERLLTIDSTAIMLVVVVPVILATLAFAWWYRSSNERANRSTSENYEGRLEFVTWSIPVLIVILLSGVIWISSHDLDPRAPIPAKAAPLRVDVVALDWKWLFIYPDQNIASVNELVFPAGTPVSFQLTSATVMNAFFIPQLGSQIYAMGGMATHLNLLADAPGEYPGFSSMLSGNGFSDMRFIAKAVPAVDFAAWVKTVQAAGSPLDAAGYAALAKPSTNLQPITYPSVEANLFQQIIDQTTSGAGQAPAGAACCQPAQPAGSWLLGRLTWAAIPFHEPIALFTGVAVAAIILAVLALVTVKGWWAYLWGEWLTSVDHKRIGVMYVAMGLLMLVRGFADAIMMRTQQAIAIGDAQGYLPPDHYYQIISAHGVIMIFFVAMPLVIGLMNFVVPLQLGVRDVAFPRLNSVSFWLTASGVLLVNMSLVIGNFARASWWNYPPLSEIAYSPDVGVDYYLWSLQISGVGTLLTGVNFVTTILKLRAPGMTYFRMPVFCWTALATNMMIVAVFPILTATFMMLLLDRYLGMHFFTNDGGGNPMMYVSLFWAWGHPEVYILVLPAFGVYSEVIATFSGKGLFSYRSMVLATLGICVLSLMVWLHHFFTMGAGADVNAFFGIMSSIIAVPTGVKIFNWLFTMYRGRVVFTTPVLYTVGFMITFVIGGLTGVLLAVPPVDFVLHNSAFLVAHFHNVIIGGVLFGALAGYNYWFPKVFGFTLDDRLGKASFWCWFAGFYLAFTPLYVLGLMGMTRRLQHIADPTWRPWLLVAELGAVVILCGILCQVAQLYVSIRTRERRRDLTGDPWNGRTLEWATSSPPPAYNFATLPQVQSIDAFWDMKHRGISPIATVYEPIEMPRNSPVGFIVAFFAVIIGFALIWHIWWMTILGLLAAAITALVSGWSDDREREIPAAEVAKLERARLGQVQSA